MSIDDASVQTVQNAICAAQSLFDILKDIPIPGHPNISPTARAGLQAGMYISLYTPMETSFLGQLLWATPHNLATPLGIVWW